MHNGALAEDYVARARKRLRALDALLAEADWPDVVREAQEVVELALTGLLRAIRVVPPRRHDVSGSLRAHAGALPPTAQAALDELTRISQRLRRDRELAFYGAEDVLPLEFYSEEDAREARAQAEFVVEVCERALAELRDGS